jgi:AAA15 family ATPase/GTPase
MLNEQTHFQTILTTHNTSLLSNELSRPDCSFIMHRSVENDETIQISSLSNLTEREIRKVHNLEKMYRSGAFGYNV